MKAIWKKLILRIAVTIVFSYATFSNAASGATVHTHHETKSQAHQQQSTACPKVRIYTIRGLMDVFSLGMNSLANRIETKLSVPAYPISHIEAKNLANFLIHDEETYHCHAPIVLIGHSFGADNQLWVAHRLSKHHLPIALMVNLEHTSKQLIPPNVKVFYNISSEQSDNRILPWGVNLDKSNPNTKVINIDLSKNTQYRRVNHFNIDKSREVQEYIITLIKENVLAKTP